MNIFENINELVNVTGGTEAAADPPKYLTPEGEAEAKRRKEIAQMLMRSKLYKEAIPGSGLMIRNGEQ